MAFNYSPMGIPFKLTPEDMGAVDYGTALKKGIESYYAPQMAQAQIGELKARAQKNAMMGQLFNSLLGGEGAGGGFQGNNMKAAVLKAFTGIDPFLMSPQEQKELQTQTAINTEARKQNIRTGSSDIARESLQNIVSMPKEYMGAFGSIKMVHDRALAEKGDKTAKERLIQAAVAERLVPEYSGFQLQSQGQKATVPALQHQREAIRQGWPHLSHVITHNLPSDLQKEVENRHNKAVRDVNRLREKFLSSNGQRDYSGSNTSDREYGININEQAHNLGVDPSHIIEDSQYFKTSPENIISALQAGVKTEDEMRDWLKGLKK